MKSLAIAILFSILGLLAGIAFMTFGTSIFSKPPAIPTSQSSARPDLSITASAPFIASQLQQTLRQNNLAKNATVTFVAPNLARIAATQDVSVLGFSIALNATATMRVSVQNGRILLKTESVDTGGLPIPQPTLDATVERLRAQAEEQMNRVVQSGLRGTGLRVSNIRITESDVTVELSQ